MRTLHPFVAISILLAACSGSGDDGASMDDYSQAFAASVRADQSEDSVQVTTDEALCIGVAVADEIGLERLREEGTPDEIEKRTEDDLSMFDLSAARALEIADSYIGCIPDYVDQFAGSLDTDETVADCVADELDVDDLRRPTAAAINGDELSDADLQFLFDALGRCDTSDASDADLSGYVDAVAAATLADGATLGITADEARCFAQDVVTVVGSARLLEAGDPDQFVAVTQDGLTLVGLSDGEIETIAASYFDCSPTAALEFRQLFLEGTGLVGEQRDCVDRLVSDEVLVAIVAASLAGRPGESALEGLESEFDACA